MLVHRHLGLPTNAFHLGYVNVLFHRFFFNLPSKHEAPLTSEYKITI